MVHWLQLLAGSLACGAGIVWGMVLPRPFSLLSLAGAGISLLAAGSAAAAISRTYETPEALLAALLFTSGGIAAGYGIAAASLPLLTSQRTVPVASGSSATSHEALVLLACTDPDRYDPRAVATQGADLAQNGAIDVPLAATPFVYLAEKARYRALGGRCPGASLAAVLREETVRMLAGRDLHPDVRLAWSHSRPSLANAVAELASAGVSAVGIVVLGTEDSDAVDRAKAELDASLAGQRALRVSIGPSLWQDRALPDRLVERITESIGDVDRASVGVVLACAGQPATPERNHAVSSAEDTYFNQRVRMLLADAGLDERLIRVGWFEWQQPDVTESARHLAALGCTHLVIVPSTVVLPTVATAIDMRHAVELARLPGSVTVRTLSPWGDDTVMVDAIVRSAVGALETLRRPYGP